MIFLFSTFKLFPVQLGCGGVSSENNTYIVQSSTTTSPASPSCTYQICPCSSDICRIRFDFTKHVLADQTEGAPSNTAGSLVNNFAIGDCAADQFSISSPNSIGSPTICGYNTGQHSKLHVFENNTCSVLTHLTYFHGYQ